MTPGSAPDIADQSPAWQALAEHARTMRGISLADLFRDRHRTARLQFRAAPLALNLSRQRMDARTLEGLLQLADERNLFRHIDALFAGDHINHSEGSAAMHWALRLDERDRDPAGVLGQVRDVQHRMVDLSHRIRNGQWTGFSGARITDVVCLGVGGSQLGSKMAVTALADPLFARPTVHFASSVDGLQMARLLPALDPRSTLFLICSKSFRTRDTLDNARIARDWLTAASGHEGIALGRHFIGVSARDDLMREWGLPEDNRLAIWDWVGGRYSLCSAMGLPVMLAVGTDAFFEMLAGARAMDRHFLQAPAGENLPVLLGLTDIWNRNFLGINTRAVLPYDTRLACLPAWLEQLEMESGGKSVTRDGSPVQCRTAPVVWGGMGLDAQHAFYQFLHQGTEEITCDFLASVRAPGARDAMFDEHLRRQHQRTLANCFANAEALALGNQSMSLPQTAPECRHPGNRTSTMLMLDDITPESIGALTALYEHKVFVQAMVWEINPFDQWGIELGKTLTDLTFRRLETGTGEQVLRDGDLFNRDEESTGQ